MNVVGLTALAGETDTNKFNGKEEKRIYRIQQAVKLRIEGNSYEKIAKLLKVSRGTAFNYVKEHFDKVREETKEDIRQYRDLQIKRNEDLIKSLWIKAKAGDGNAIDRIAKLQDQNAKLLGTYTPIKVAPTDPSGENIYDPEIIRKTIAERIKKKIEK